MEAGDTGDQPGAQAGVQQGTRGWGVSSGATRRRGGAGDPQGPGWGQRTPNGE